MNALEAELLDVVGSKGLIVDPTRLLPYESDALAMVRAQPRLVLLPRDTEETSACLRIIHSRIGFITCSCPSAPKSPRRSSPKSPVRDPFVPRLSATSSTCRPSAHYLPRHSCIKVTHDLRRTLQQNAFGAFLATVKAWAALSPSHFDARNGFTVERSREIVELLGEYNLKPPFI